MFYPKSISAATIVAFGLIALGSGAYAQSSKSTSKSSSKTMPKSSKSGAKAASAGNQMLIPFSPAGHEAIHEIEDARLAIFNGDIDVARQLVVDAMASVETAEEDAPILLESATVSVNGKEVGEEDEADELDIVPVDGEVTLAEDYVPTPEKQKHINKANMLMKSGKQKEALNELKLADIGVNVSRIWMPISFTEEHLEGALALMDESKYYEANLALKAIEDSLTLDSETIVEQAPTKTAKK